MDTPLDVRLIFSSRKALLLLTPVHDSTPSTNVFASSWTYSIAATVSGLLITTLFFSSTILPPCAHSSECSQVSPSPVAWLMAKPGGCPFLAMRWHSLRKLGRSVGKRSKPASRIHDTR